MVAGSDGQRQCRYHDTLKKRKGVITIKSKPKIKILEIIEIKPKLKAKKKNIITVKPQKDDDELRETNKKKARTKHRWVIRTELGKHKENIRMILGNSNATPIGRYGGIGYGCCFCSHQTQTPGELKLHTQLQHDNAKSIFMEKANMPCYIVKLDITDLKCELCQMNIETLGDLIDHLKSIHNKYFYSDIKDHIIPFKFETGHLVKCVVCGNGHNNFKVLLEHMNTHYKNYICDVCGAGFVNKRILQTHSARHKTGDFRCSYCDKEFNNAVKKRDHERAVHISGSMRSKCGYCGEKFSDYAKKNNHEVKVHGAQPVVLTCQACQKTFDNQRSLTVHTKAYHLMERRCAK